MSNAETFTAAEIQAQAARMSNAEMGDWINNLVTTVNEIIERRGEEHSEANVARWTNLVLKSMQADGTATGRKCTLNTMAAMVKDSQQRGSVAWEA